MSRQGGPVLRHGQNKPEVHTQRTLQVKVRSSENPVRGQDNSGTQKMALLRVYSVGLALLAMLALTGGAEEKGIQTETPHWPTCAGIPGRDGRDGRDGPEGPRGQKGEKGDTGQWTDDSLIAVLQTEVNNLKEGLSKLEKAASFRFFRKAGSKFYMSNGEVASFIDGQSLCSSAGGSMVLPRNEAENQALTNFFSTISVDPPHVYLAATDARSEGTWVDTAGLTLGFLKWAHTEPQNYGGQEHCVVMRKSGEWADIKCIDKYAIICEV
ncbi:hypothetical protein AGOR_G00080830 [Albula goreensis]|uniref:C-type lectin domain-containing protein n=1 Tax=Albula goreensis TaxID=1534307 RepID=A0A8T3DSH3_9TELE|nr:hypothetical protein AGOR_G00080830 [Albula goreensis]